MIQELLPFLPPALTTGQAAICVALLLLGVFLWLAGAVWSRGILALIAVAGGGLLGMMLPRWQNWPLNTMSPRRSIRLSTIGCYSRWHNT